MWSPIGIVRRGHEHNLVPRPFPLKFLFGGVWKQSFQILKVKFLAAVLHVLAYETISLILLGL